MRGLPRCSCVQRHPHHIWSVFWRAVPLGAEQLHQLGARGRAVQVDPIKPTLKALGTKRLKQKYVELLSNFAFNFNLRRYIAVMNRANMAGPAARQPPSMAADSAFSGVSNIENIAPTPAYNQRPGAANNNGGGGGGGGPMRPSDFNKPQMVKLPVINSVTPGQRPGLMVGPATLPATSSGALWTRLFCHALQRHMPLYAGLADITRRVIDTLVGPTFLEINLKGIL